MSVPTYAQQEARIMQLEADQEYGKNLIRDLKARVRELEALVERLRTARRTTATERDQALADELPEGGRPLFPLTEEKASSAEARKRGADAEGRAQQAIAERDAAWERGKELDARIAAVEARTRKLVDMTAEQRRELDTRIANAKRLIDYWKRGAEKYWPETAAMTTHPLAMVESALDGQPLHELLPEGEIK